MPSVIVALRENGAKYRCRVEPCVSDSGHPDHVLFLEPVRCRGAIWFDRSSALVGNFLVLEANPDEIAQLNRAGYFLRVVKRHTSRRRRS
jgi:hypothetical protein